MPDKQHDRATSPPTKAAQPAHPLPTSLPQAGQTPPLSSTATTSLLLRNAAASAAKAVTLAGVDREISIMIAADQLARAFREVRSLHEIESVRWGTITPALDLAAQALRALSPGLLRPHHKELLGTLIQGWKELGSVIDPAEWKIDAQPDGTPAPAKALSNDEQFALGEQAVAGAIVKADAFLTTPKKEDAARQCTEIHLHVRQALDSAQQLDVPFQFSGRVLDLSERLELVNRYLSSIDAPWDRSFARLFEAEAQLRKVVGITTIAERSYRGTADPKKLLELVTSLAKAPTDTNDKDRVANHHVGRIVEPQQAIRSMAIDIGASFDFHHRALGDLGENLQAVVPDETSWMDQFLMVVANLLLTATTGAMGSLIGRGFTAAIDKQYAGAAKQVIRQHEENLTKRMSSGARKKMMASLTEGTSLQRSLQASLAKDLTMSLLTKGQTLGIAATPKPTAAPRASSHAITLRDYFIQTNQNALLATKTQALHQLNDLSADLAQLDIDILAPLAMSMRDMGQPTYDATYDEALRQWQNTKARAASPARRSNFAPINHEVDLSGATKARGEAPVPGVVEVGLYAGRDVRAATLDYLVLRDGEAAAVSHLQKHPRTLGELDMNLMYQINFTPDAFLSRRADNHKHEHVAGVPVGTFVKFGIRRGGKVQASSFTSHELDVMRMFVAALDPAEFPSNAVLSKVSPKYRFKHVSAADAIAAALAIVSAVADLTTRDIKKG